MMRDTPAGRKGSAKYNATVRLETLRCAMVGQLRLPPVGFEEVTTRHFAMCRQRIVVQARRWMLEARDTDLYSRYERTYAELLSLLDTDAMREYESLAPLPDDLEALETLDSSFVRMIHSKGNNVVVVGGDGDEEDEPNSLNGQLTSNPWAVPTEQANPWAAGAGSVGATTRHSAAGMGNDGDSSDDELYG